MQEDLREKTSSQLQVHPFVRWSMMIAFLITGIAIAYAATLGLILDAVRGFYRIETWRQSLLNQRLIGYRGFLFAFALATYVFAFVLRHSATFNQIIHQTAWSRSWKRFCSILLVSICIAIGIWLSYSLWLRYGRPCWDGYCSYAWLIRAWLSEPSSGNQNNLLSFMHHDYHSNSPTGPILIAILCILTSLNIDLSYALMSGLATIGSLALCWSWLGREENRLGWIRLPAFLLLLTHPALVRSFVFLQTDALASFWIMAVIGLGLLRFRSPRFWQLAVGALLLSTGLLVKLSFLPALTFLPAMELVRSFRLHAHLVRTVLVASFAFLIVPLISFFLFQYLMGTRAMFAREVLMRGYIDRDIAFIIEVTLRTLLFFVPLILVGWKRFQMDDFLLGICLMIYLFSLWFGRAPGWDRHYLPLIPPFVVLAAKGLKSVAERFGRAPVWAYVLLSGLLQYSVFGFKIVH